MNEKLEQVIRAIGASYDGYVDPVETPISWATAESAACAALEALREPTDEMLEAAWSSNWQGLSHNIAKRAWQAMCDEVLK